MVLCSGKERGKGETATVQFLKKSKFAVNFVEFSRHLLPVVSDLLYQFPLWLCDLPIPALDVTTVKNYGAVKRLLSCMWERGCLLRVWPATAA